MMEIDQALASLRSIIRDFGSVLVAYSGGVDSALVLAMAHQELQDRALGCIATSPSYPRRELDAALELARQLGANCRTIATREHLDGAYAANGVDRCYFCKSELYHRLHEIAEAENWKTIANGTNTNDIGDHRFGMAAATQNGVRSPLLEAGISKPEVRQIARQLGLAVWDKPSTPCLSSRVPRGTAITPQILQTIEAAEDVLAHLGFRQFRVRHHGQMARLEIPPDELPRVLANRDEILLGIRAAGYQIVAVDLAGLPECNHIVMPTLERRGNTAKA